MSEYIVLGGLFPNQIEEPPFGSRARDYEQVPKINSAEEFEKVEELESPKRFPLELRTYVTPREELNRFLVSKFKHNITDFMRWYGKAHLEALGAHPTDDDVNLIVAIHPLPANIVCFLMETDDARELSSMLFHYQATVIENHLGMTQLNLHDDNVRKFTLIRAKFNLETEKKHFNFGYHFSTEKFRFFVKSSSQFDLSVVYEAL